MITNKNDIDINMGREVIYVMLSDIFIKTPSKDLLDKLSNLMPYLKELAVDSNNRLLIEGIGGMEKFIQSRDSKSEGELENFYNDLLLSYTRLFCLSDSVSLSESVYLSPGHLTMQECTGEVYDIYEKYNFNIKDFSLNESVDHLSCEFMFMAYISKGIVRCLEQGNDSLAKNFISAQIKFLDEHILRWADKVVDKLLKYPESVYFYLPVSYFMFGFLKDDREFLRMYED